MVMTYIATDEEELIEPRFKCLKCKVINSTTPVRLGRITVTSLGEGAEVKPFAGPQSHKPIRQSRGCRLGGDDNHQRAVVRGLLDGWLRKVYRITVTSKLESFFSIC